VETISEYVEKSAETTHSVSCGAKRSSKKKKVIQINAENKGNIEWKKFFL
jgi:hypothetical protein